MSAPGAGVAVNFPGLPEYEQKKSTDTTTATGGATTTQNLSDVQQQALEQQAASLDAQKAGTQEVRAQAERVNAIEAQGAFAEQEAAAWKLKQLGSQAALDVDQQVARARENVQAQQARYAAMPAPKLFADGKGWDNTRKAIALAFGGLGDAIRARAAILAHQSPPTISTVMTIIDNDIARQKAAIDKQKDSVVMARTGLADAEDARRQLRGDIDLKGMAMLDNAKKLTAARLAAAKVDQPAIDQHQAILALDQKKSDYKAEYVKGLTTSIQSKWDQSQKVGTDVTNRSPTAGGGGVEADKNAANFAVLKNHGTKIAAQMPDLSPDDIKAIQRVMNTEDFADEHGGLKAAAGTLGLDPETGLSSTAKAYLTDVRSAAEGLGRVQSGAAIGSTENKRFVRSMMPQISDKREDLVNRGKSVLDDIDARGQYMARPPRNQPGAAPGQPPAPGAQGAAPPAPPPKPSNPARDALIANLKRNPGWRKTSGAAAAMKKYGVTEDDLK